MRERLHAFGGMCWLVLVPAAVMAAFIEPNFYDKLLSAEFVGDVALASAFDRFLLVWLLFAKNVTLFLPMMLVFSVCSWKSYHRLGRGLLDSGLVLLVFVLMLDVLVQFKTGNHITAYWEFLLTPKHWQWAGDPFQMARRLLVGLVLVACVVLLTLSGLRLLGRTFSKRINPRLCYGFSIAGMAMYLVGMAAYPLAQAAASPQTQLVLSVAAKHLLCQPLFSPWEDSRHSNTHSVTDPVSEELTSHLEQILIPRPANTDFQIPIASRKNVVLFVLESFRADVLNPRVMPRLSQLAAEGMRFNNHYSSSNMSHFGMFSLLYGRTPLVYNQTLDAGIPPQLAITMKVSGYQTAFFTSGDCQAFHRISEYLCQPGFDETLILDTGEWMERDRKLMAHLIDKLKSSEPDSPVFVVCFLMSTHFPYSFLESPAAPQAFTPYAAAEDCLHSENSSADVNLIHNRYRNAARDLDGVLAETVAALGVENNVFLFTGDHAESFYDDGKLFHGSRLSDAQTRVPLVIYGDGVPRRSLDWRTGHCDVFPTLIKLLSPQSQGIPFSHGRNLLGISDSSPDSLLIVHGLHNLKEGRHHDRVVFLSGDETRLPLLINRSNAGITPLELVDRHDRIHSHSPLTASKAEDLSRSLVAEFQRLAGSATP